MENLYKVSVVIPTFNIDQYVGACIESLQNQTLRETQFIFVDDCSTDNTVAVIKHHAASDKRISLYSLEENSGPAVVRNFGLLRAQGKYVQFVDGDDLIPRDALEKLYAMAKAQDADLVRGNGVSFSMSDPDTFVPMQNVKWVETQTGLDYTRENFHGSPWYHVLFLIKVSFLLDHKISYPELRMGEDPVFLLNVLTHARNAATIPETVYRYRAGMERQDPHTDPARIKDHFTHLIMMKNLWLEQGLDDRWNEYLNATFWWSWEHFMCHNFEAISENIDKINEIFSSLSEQGKQGLSKNRLVYCQVGAVGNAGDIYKLSFDVRDLPSKGEGGDQSSGNSAELDMLYHELIHIYTSKSWQLTRPFRKVYGRYRIYKETKMLKESPSFDANWYLDRYTDVSQSRIDPARHYLLHGWLEGRDPSQSFSTNEYLREYPQLKITRVNPLVHYLHRREGSTA